eukprot:scaffold111177_cov81-Phaeocystis_antarctica.AAC.1
MIVCAKPLLDRLRHVWIFRVQLAPLRTKAWDAVASALPMLRCQDPRLKPGGARRRVCVHTAAVAAPHLHPDAHATPQG